MKRASDIYKKPPLAIKEVLAVLFVSLLALLFFSVEAYKYLNTALHESNQTAIQTTQPVVHTPDVAAIPATKEVIPQPLIVEKPDLTDAFHAALKDENITALSAMIASIKEDNATLDTQTIDLHEMIATRSYKTATFLIEHELFPIDMRNQHGRTILHEAALKGHEGLIRLIISKGADINAQTPAGISALHYPVRLGYTITTHTLLALGINPNLKATLAYSGLYWRGSTPLHIAAIHGREALFKKLLEHGALLEEKDGDGLSVLDLARKHGHPELEHYILTLEGFKTP